MFWKMAALIDKMVAITRNCENLRLAVVDRQRHTEIHELPRGWHMALSRPLRSIKLICVAFNVLVTPQTKILTGHCGAEKSAPIITSLIRARFEILFP